MKTKIRSFYIAVLLTVASNTFAQPSEKIEAGRPGKSQTPFVVPAKTFQAEIGLQFEKQQEDLFEYQHPEAVLKYGLFNRFELRAIIKGVTDETRQPKISETGLEPVEFGLKTLITKGKGFIPHTSFTADFGIPSLASESFKANKVFPKLRMVMQNELSDKISLIYTAGPEWDGEENGPTWIYTVSPQFEIGEKLEFFVEEYAHLKKNKSPEHSMDAGFAYFITKNVKADIFAGAGLSEEASKYFVSTGLSFRF